MFVALAIAGMPGSGAAGDRFFGVRATATGCVATAVGGWTEGAVTGTATRASVPGRPTPAHATASITTNDASAALLMPSRCQRVNRYGVDGTSLLSTVCAV